MGGDTSHNRRKVQRRCTNCTMPMKRQTNALTCSQRCRTERSRKLRAGTHWECEGCRTVLNNILQSCPYCAALQEGVE